MIDQASIDRLLQKLSVPYESPRADEIRGMIGEAVEYVRSERDVPVEALALSGVAECDDAAWITIEPTHVSFLV